MNTIKTKNTKAARLYLELQREINAGAYPAGEQLPSCRVLAEKYNVSYVTASQVLKTLVAEGLAWNERGKGIFLRVNSNETHHIYQRRVKLLCPFLVFPNAVDFMQLGTQVFSSDNWAVKQVIASSVEAIQKEFEDVENFFILFGYNFALYRKIIPWIEKINAQKRVAVLGERVDQFGIASIVANESHIISIAMKELMSKGLSKIALVCGNLGNSVEQERFAAWRNYYKDNEQWKDLFLYIDLPPDELDYNSFIAKYYERIHKDGRFDNIDAIIGVTPKHTAILSKMLQSWGYSIPDDISLVSVGDAEYLEYMTPKITVVGAGLDEHIKRAKYIFEDHFEQRNVLPLLHLCEPSYVERESIKQA